MDELSIGEVARQAGLRPSAVRYYERLGLLPLPSRVNGRRRYTPDIVRDLTVIQFAQRAGFTLAEIRGLLHSRGSTRIRSENWRESMREKLIQLDEMIERIHEMQGMLERGLECACQQPEECVIQDRSWWFEKESP